MAFGIRLYGVEWRDLFAAALAYIGSFIAAIDYALARLPFMSSF
ncbi:hypothetical protein GCM10011504_46170 [Siccirubricoccus deserti]|nr:hypothetical protein [Siccirubricoccus deserti]GGC62747.1 hypothetical protein GCM10011504_46170 [Siccirubricoccus deserti]